MILPLFKDTFSVIYNWHCTGCCSKDIHFLKQLQLSLLIKNSHDSQPKFTKWLLLQQPWPQRWPLNVTATKLISWQTNKEFSAKTDRVEFLHQTVILFHYLKHAPENSVSASIYRKLPCVSHRYAFQRRKFAQTSSLVVAERNGCIPWQCVLWSPISITGMKAQGNLLILLQMMKAFMLLPGQGIKRIPKILTVMCLQQGWERWTMR